MSPNPWLDMLNLINGYQITQAIRVASTLRVADHLKRWRTIHGRIGVADAEQCRRVSTGCCVRLPPSVCFGKARDERLL